MKRLQVGDIVELLGSGNNYRGRIVKTLQDGRVFVQFPANDFVTEWSKDSADYVVNAGYGWQWTPRWPDHVRVPDGL